MYVHTEVCAQGHVCWVGVEVGEGYHLYLNPVGIQFKLTLHGGGGHWVLWAIFVRQGI